MLFLYENTPQPRAHGHFFVDFEDIGTLTVLYEVYEPLAVGQHYRVVYSPHSKRGWAIGSLTA